MTAWLRTGLSWLLLAVLAGTPAFVAVCLASCAEDRAEVAPAALSCHATAERSVPAMASATADPCGTHDGAAAELAARLKPLRDGIEQPSSTTPLTSSSPHHALLLALAVTPRPAPPGPSRPLLALRI
jgi:hypothetical protein